ncbi:type II restriction endonuclease [Knoellia locipacati]|uniref:type II restriction endonuclease n=1 Tax=Knoellia locipacati TaxID=882824 RepID=UPI00384F5A19
MASSLADQVIAQALEYGGAFLKVIQPNDVGITGGHQRGFHLSKLVHGYFTPQPPDKGINHDHEIRLEWSDGTVTDSVIKWYGVGTRAEYRLTRFNKIREFWPLRPERLGSVLVLIRRASTDWLGHVLDDAEDVDEVTAALGLNLDDSSWALYTDSGGRVRSTETSSECEHLGILAQVREWTQFPTTAVMSATARRIAESCGSSDGLDADDVLMKHVTLEYDMFKALEDQLVLADVSQRFDAVDSFLRVAQSITQRRKARAGKSLEEHLKALLLSRRLLFEPQPTLDGTKPDFVVPSAAKYYAASDDELDDVLVIAAKTTCKDRWRQVSAEAPRVRTRYLVTLQKGVSSNQIREMREARVQLVVPRVLHDAYAPDDRGYLMTIEDFIKLANQKAA